MLRIRISTLIALSLLALSPAAIFAQEGTPQDSEDFGIALAKSGYHDLGIEVIDTALKDATGAAKTSLEFAKIRIQAESAKTIRDIKERATKLKEAAEGYQKYIRENPDSPRATDVRIEIVDIYRIIAEQQTNALKAEKDKAKAEEMRKEARDAFSKALAIIEPRVADLMGIDPRSEKENVELMALRFALGKMSYLYAGVFEDKKSVESVRRIEKAKEVLEEFLIDYTTEVLSFEAGRILALVAIDEGRLDDALEVMNESCATLSDALANEPSLGQNDVIREIVASCFHDRAEFLLKKKNLPDEAIKTVEDIDKLMPTLALSYDGRAALVMIADVHANEGRNDKAKAYCERVLKVDDTDRVADDARNLLDRLGGASSEGKGGLLKALEGAVTQRDIPRAEKLAARIIARRNVDDNAEDVGEALFLLGSGYFLSGRLYDAAATLGSLADDFPKHKRAPTAKLNEGFCYSGLFKIDKSASWRDRFRHTQESLTKNWPDSEEAKEQAFNNGTLAEQEGKLPEAIDLFKKVSATSSKFPDAQLRIGINLFTLGQEANARSKNDEAKKAYTDAIAAFTLARSGFQRLAKSTLNEADQKLNYAKAFDAGIRTCAIYLQSQIKGADKCIPLLVELEKDAGADKDKISKVWSLRIKSFTQLGRGKDAVTAFEEYMKTAEKSGGVAAVSETAIQIASTLDGETFDLQKSAKKDSPEVLDGLKNAARFYRMGVQGMKQGGGGRQQAGKVGGRLLSIASQLMNLPANLPLYAIDKSLKLTEKESIERAMDALSMVSDSVNRSGAAVTLNVDLLRNIAKCNALIGKWPEAVDSLEKIVSANALFSADGRYDKAAADKVPDLADIYQDYAVARIRAGAASKTPATINKAISDLNYLLAAADRDGRMYWESTYIQMLGLLLSPDYEKLKASLDSLERKAPVFDDDRYGIRSRLLELKKEVGDKVIDK